MLRKGVGGLRLFKGLFLGLSLFLLSCEPQYNADAIYLGVQVSPSESYESVFSTLNASKTRFPAFFTQTQSFNSEFPLAFSKSVLEKGSVPYIIWDPQLMADFDARIVSDIVDGLWDDAIRKFAQSAQSVEFPVFIDFFPVSFGPERLADGEMRRLYKAAYLHVVSIFNEENALNVNWVWSVSATSMLSKADLALLYPGKETVQWVRFSVPDNSVAYQEQAEAFFLAYPGHRNGLFYAGPFDETFLPLLNASYASAEFVIIPTPLSKKALKLMNHTHFFANVEAL